MACADIVALLDRRSETPSAVDEHLGRPARVFDDVHSAIDLDSVPGPGFPWS